MIRARPTIYRGVQMRSRLEATAAQQFDEQKLLWTYEPQCFADETGQYLPDFRIGLRDASSVVNQILSELRKIVDDAEGRDLTDQEANDYERLDAALAEARRQQKLTPIYLEVKPFTYVCGLNLAAPLGEIQRQMQIIHSSEPNALLGIYCPDHEPRLVASLRPQMPGIWAVSKDLLPELEYVPMPVITTDFPGWSF